jgi:hypothetical protein
MLGFKLDVPDDPFATEKFDPLCEFEGVHFINCWRHRSNFLNSLLMFSITTESTKYLLYLSEEKNRCLSMPFDYAGVANERSMIFVTDFRWPHSLQSLF